ncbi:MAG: M1 family metallopeptidase [Bacteroidia bacterium]
MTKKYIWGISVLVCISVLVACKTTDATKKTNPPAKMNTTLVDMGSPIASSGVAENERFSYHETRKRSYDLVHTHLVLKFDYENRRIMGEAILSITPYFHPIDSVVLDAKGFDIHAISLSKNTNNSQNKEGLATLAYRYDQQQIRIALDKTYSTQDTFLLHLRYTAKPYERTTSSGVAISSDRGVYFVNHDKANPKLPQQIWTQGETTANSAWFPTFDSPNDKCTEYLILTYPAEYLSVANGKKVHSFVNEDNTKTDHWEQKLPHSPYLFAFAIGDFGEYKDKWRDKEVNYYQEKKYAPYSKAVFGNTPEMMEFFSNKLGMDYPWDKYSQVVVREFVSGAMENTGCSIFFDKLNKDNRELLDESHDDIIAHELFHHWFGDLVTCESYGNLSLNEGFASYSEYLWFEHKYGKDAADYHLHNDLLSYLGEASYKKEAIIRYRYDKDDDLFDRHSYQKGACVLHALRSYVGDKAFFAALNYYLKKHAFETVELADLRMAFEKVTGEDLNWFFNQWFLSPGHPELNYAYQADSEQIKINISQYQDANPVPVYRLPLTLEIQDANGTERVLPIEINNVDTTFVIPNVGKVMNLVLDAEGTLVGTINRAANEVEMQHQLSHSKNYRHRIIAAEYLALLSNKSDATINALKRALKDPFWAVRRQAMEGLIAYEGIRKKELIREILPFAMTDNKSAIRALALASLKKEGSLEPFHNKKISLNLDSILQVSLNDSSYVVQNEALSIASLWNDSLAQNAALTLTESRNELLRLSALRVLQTQKEGLYAEKIFDTIEKIEGTNEKYFAIHSFLPPYLENLPEAKKAKGIVMLLNIAEKDIDWWIRLNAAEVLKNYMHRIEVRNYVTTILAKETKPELQALYREIKKEL